MTINDYPEGHYETCEDCDNKVTFHWKPSRFEIIDKTLQILEGDHTKGWVRMDRFDFIEFLLKSEFLAQHGYKIVKEDQISQS